MTDTEWLIATVILAALVLTCLVCWLETPEE
jgi:hypothetical protein